jgi:hypothetical protein
VANVRPDVVDTYRRIENLAAWCDRRLAAIHQHRYTHLSDREFSAAFRWTLRQWADEQADRTAGHTRNVYLGARGDRPWEPGSNDYARTVHQWRHAA